MTFHKRLAEICRQPRRLRWRFHELEKDIKAKKDEGDTEQRASYDSNNFHLLFLSVMLKRPTVFLKLKQLPLTSAFPEFRGNPINSPPHPNPLAQGEGEPLVQF